MTVRELQEQLAGADPDAVVLQWHAPCWLPLGEIQLKFGKPDSRGSWWPQDFRLKQEEGLVPVHLLD